MAIRARLAVFAMAALTLGPATAARGAPPAALAPAAEEAARLAVPQPPALATRRVKAKDVAGTREHDVLVTASSRVDARLLDYLSTQLRIRIAPPGALPARGAAVAAVAAVEEPPQPDPGAAELALVLADGGAKLDPRRVTWLWPDGFELARPGVLRPDPELAAGLARNPSFRFAALRKDDVDPDVGSGGGTGGGSGGGGGDAVTVTLRGRLACKVPGATSDVRFAKVRGGGGSTRTRADGSFELAGTFAPGPITLKVVYDAPIASGLAGGSTELVVMDEVQDARSEEVRGTGTATGSGALEAGTLTLSSADCELWRLGVVALEAYHAEVKRPPPAGKLRIKRWSEIRFGTPHTYYDYVVVRTDFTSGDYAREWRRRSTIFHEFGHSVRHVADGDEAHWGWDNFRWAYARNHGGCEVFNTQFAFNEGWANYRERLAVATTPNCTMPSDDHLDWNETLVGYRLEELQGALPPGAGQQRMVAILEANPGAIHSLHDFERRYCAAVTLPNPHCTKDRVPKRGGVVVAQAPSCPPDYVDDGATCRRPQVKTKDSYGRGAGVVPTGCGSGELDAGLCYPKCSGGYDGVGPVCWQACPSGFRDDGAFCAKPEPYGRGGGYPWELGDEPFSLSGARARCQRDHGAGRCEQDGALFYPKCRAGFHATGCCICSPNCVSGMVDIGVSCAKKSYGRGAGTVPTSCQGGKQYDAGLCYEPCRAGFHGVGPVCWGSCEPGFADHGATCYRDASILVKY